MGKKRQMRLPVAVLLVCVAVGVVLLLARGYWGPWVFSKRGALVASRVSHMSRVLRRLQRYSEDNGHLPESLDALPTNGPLGEIDLSVIHYSPSGFDWVADSDWILWTECPAGDDRVIAGRRPGVVDVRRRHTLIERDGTL